jgi:DNA primase
MLTLGIGVADAFRWVRCFAGSDTPPGSTRPPDRAIASPSGRQGGPLPPRAAVVLLTQFCIGRGWRVEVAERFGLSVVRRGGLRIRFPYRSHGEVRWWQDRAVGTKQEPRWLAPPRHQARPVPYAYDLHGVLETARRSNVVMLAEGPSDVIALAHTDWPVPVIALPGGALGSRGPTRLSTALTELDVVTIFDGDAQGDRYRESYGPALVASGCRVAHLRPPQGLDLDAWRRACGADDRVWGAALEAAMDGVHWGKRGHGH